MTLPSARLDYSQSFMHLFHRRCYSAVQTTAILVGKNERDLEKATVCFMPVLSFYPDRANFLQSKMACASCAAFLFLPHFEVICDLLLNRRTATWNAFVLYNNKLKYMEKMPFYFKFRHFDRHENSTDLI